jgi:hypothetical protein
MCLAFRNERFGLRERVLKMLRADVETRKLDLIRY